MDQDQDQDQVHVVKTLMFDDSVYVDEERAEGDNGSGGGGYDSEDELIVLQGPAKDHMSEGESEGEDEVDAAEEDHNNTSEFVIRGAVGLAYDVPRRAGEDEDEEDDEDDDMEVAHIKSTTTPYIKPKQPGGKQAAGMRPKRSEEVSCGGGLNTSVAHSSAITPSRIIMPTEKHQTRPMSPTRSKNESDFGRKLLSQRKHLLEAEMEVEGGRQVGVGPYGSTSDDDRLLFDRCSIASSMDGLAHLVEITSQKVVDDSQGQSGSQSGSSCRGVSQSQGGVEGASLSNSDSATVVVHTRPHGPDRSGHLDSSRDWDLGVGASTTDGGRSIDDVCDMPHAKGMRPASGRREDEKKSHKESKTVSDGDQVKEGGRVSTPPQQKQKDSRGHSHTHTPAGDSAKSTPGSGSNHSRHTLSNSTALSLGDEWKEAFIAGSNKRYYYNRRTRESSWKLPKDAIYVKYEDNSFGIFVPRRDADTDLAADAKTASAARSNANSNTGQGAGGAPGAYSTPQRPVSNRSARAETKDSGEEESSAPAAPEVSALKAPNPNANTSIVSAMNTSGLPPHPASSARKQHSHQKAESALNQAINMTRQVLFTDTSIMDASGVHHRSPGLMASPGSDTGSGDSATRRNRRRREHEQEEEHGHGQRQRGECEGPPLTHPFAGSSSWSVLQDEETDEDSEGLLAARARLQARSNQPIGIGATQLYKLREDEEAAAAAAADAAAADESVSMHNISQIHAHGSGGGDGKVGFGIASVSVLTSVDETARRLADCTGQLAAGMHDGSYVLEENSSLDALYESDTGPADRESLQEGKDLISSFNRRYELSECEGEGEQSLELSASHAPGAFTGSAKTKTATAAAAAAVAGDTVFTPAVARASGDRPQSTGVATVVQGHEVPGSNEGARGQLEFTPLAGVDLGQTLALGTQGRPSDPLDKTRTVGHVDKGMGKDFALHEQLRPQEVPGTVENSIHVAHARAQQTPVGLHGSPTNHGSGPAINKHSTRRQLFNEDSRAAATPLIYCCFCGVAVTGAGAGPLGTSITDMVAIHVERDCEMCFGKSSAVVEDMLGALELGCKRAGVLSYKYESRVQERARVQSAPHRSPAKYVPLVASPIATGLMHKSPCTDSGTNDSAAPTATTATITTTATATATPGRKVNPPTGAGFESGDGLHACPVCADGCMRTREQLVRHMKSCLFQAPSRSPTAGPVLTGDTTIITVSTTNCPFCDKCIPKSSSLSSHFLSCAKKKEKLTALSALKSNVKPAEKEKSRDKEKDSLVKEVVVESKPRTLLSQTVTIGDKAVSLMTPTAAGGGTVTAGGQDASFMGSDGGVDRTPISNPNPPCGRGGGSGRQHQHPTPSSGKHTAGGRHGHSHSATKVWR